MRDLALRVFLVLSSLGALGCSCDSDIGSGRRTFDGGGVSGGTDGAVQMVDAQISDAGFTRTDSGPRVDGGCEATTPIMNEIVGDPPDMLLVVDVSTSMCLPLLGSTGSKLAVMKAAMSRVVTRWDARINFGMMLFPTPGGELGCGVGMVRNPIMPRNAPPIVSTLNGLSDDVFGCTLADRGATPTHTSLAAARTYYSTIPANPVGRYVVLATDGLPNCGAPNGEGGTEETVDETVAAIESLRADGINTYVVGFGFDVVGGGAALSRMATAGGTGSPFNASSPAELDTALERIAAEIVPPSCTILLDGPMRDPRLFRVSLDGGELVPRNESRTSGWDYDPAANTVTFYGPECARLESGSVASVNVDFGCPGPLI